MPWEVEFKAPNHYNPLPGYRPSPSSSSPTSAALIGAGLSAKKAALAAARKDAALLSSRPSASRKQRLASAYERSLDYRGGIRPSGAQNGSFSGRGIVVPVHVDESGGVGHSGEMRVWEGFIEEKIKQARRDGVFDNVKGRGKPMPKDEAESNPFITRTEFLMNRILKEQEAAPPWVEMQKELETTLANFRSELRASWTRRAVRIRSSEGLTPAVVREIREGWKDREWEEREKAYHEVSIKSLNDLTRKYNIIAPYNVRRTLLSLRHELDAAITSSAPLIAAELQRRLDSGISSPSPGQILTDSGKVQSITADEMGGEKEADKKDTMWKAFKRVVVEVLSRGPDPVPTEVGQVRSP
ncbi:DnaJ family protein [Rhodotorula toruloides]|uniref:DnaJ family protein n=1 Tax=Rhodotorula toruloides TaxID=5286 RepID=A0A511KFM0_RHOTO|nr:DnaJ family protein [Rhodotorula toruloides]